MKLFPQDLDVVLYETGFEDDFLERASLSKQLSELVERIETPIVLALDDTWGSGKTFFLKRWVTAHQKENEGSAVTVYFDAFENDYLSDPLISILAAVSERIPKDQQSTLQKLRGVAAKLVKPSIGIALSLATFGAKQYLNEIGDVFTDALKSEATDATQDLWSAERERKDAVKDFRELLADLTREKDAPIVIVIDELDRCRPDYALSVLEIIKHFFAVPKVHFILGINGSALENSVKARYGADIDAENYLRKFINVSFTLPRVVGAPNDRKVIEVYAANLISDMDLPQKISNRCVNLISHVSKNNEVSLRDVGKILSKIALLPQEISEKNFLRGWIDILCALLVSSVVNPKLHRKLLSASAYFEEILDFVGASMTSVTYSFEDSPNPDYDHDTTYWVVVMLFCCGFEKLEEVDGLPSWVAEIGHDFERHGFPRDPKSIPSKIQKKWIDVFRL